MDLEGESSGVLPSTEWKKKRFKKPAQQKWYAGETISIGIGQGYNAYTPLQLAQAVAVLANQGILYRPHLVRSIQDVRTGGQRMMPVTVIERLAMRPEHFAVIKAAMVGVNTEGTAAQAFAGAPYQAAGKTGTAQVFSLRGEKYNVNRVHERLQDHALYIAFAPADAPKIALAVLVENGGFGAQAAAPIARQVLDYYLLGKRKSTPAQAVPGENSPAESPLSAATSSPIERGSGVRPSSGEALP